MDRSETALWSLNLSCNLDRCSSDASKLHFRHLYCGEVGLFGYHVAVDAGMADPPCAASPVTASPFFLSKVAAISAAAAPGAGAGVGTEEVVSLSPPAGPLADVGAGADEGAGLASPAVVDG